jgi:hypothetical protein
MNKDITSHRIRIGICFVEMTKDQAINNFNRWIGSKDKCERTAIRKYLRSYGWYIVKRRSGKYQLMERLTVKNAPEKFLESIFDEVRLCLENESDYEVNLGIIEATMPAEIVRVKNVPESLNVCVLMV